MNAADAATSTRWRPLLVPGIRLARMVWRLLPWAALALLIWTGVLLLEGTERLEHLARIVIYGCLIYGVGRALIREVLSPEQPALRLLPLTDTSARALAAGLRMLLFVVVLAEVGRYLVVVGDWYDPVGAALRMIRNVALYLAAVAVGTSTGLFRWLKTREGSGLWVLTARFTGKILVPLVLLALLFLVVANGLGYVPLATFVSRNLIETGIRLVVAVLIYHYLRRALGNTLRYVRGEARSDVADAEDQSVRDVDPAMIGTEKLLDAALKLIVVVAGGFWVLGAWDLGPEEVVGLLNGPMWAGATVTWGQLLGGILKILAVVVVGWVIRMVLTYFVFPKSNTEIGVRYAVLAMLRYVVIALALVFALDGIGLDTSSLGWFFGAAGVGIGLGLQDVIGNFVSGLIMLIERPIRVGDTVKVGDAVGKVEDIRMRGTVLRTFDNMSILIPNRQMLGERVTNMSYGMGHVRVKIEIGVEYGSDPAQVKAILLGIANSHPEVLVEPAPLVWFMNFGQSSIDFTLVCYTDQVSSRFTVASELRFDVKAKLAAAGIGIPFPQMDLHVKSLPPGPTA